MALVNGTPIGNSLPGRTSGVAVFRVAPTTPTLPTPSMTPAEREAAMQANGQALYGPGGILQRAADAFTRPIQATREAIGQGARALGNSIGTVPTPFGNINLGSTPANASPGSVVGPGQPGYKGSTPTPAVPGVAPLDQPVPTTLRNAALGGVQSGALALLVIPPDPPYVPASSLPAPGTIGNVPSAYTGPLTPEGKPLIQPSVRLGESPMGDASLALYQAQLAQYRISEAIRAALGQPPRTVGEPQSPIDPGLMSRSPGSIVTGVLRTEPNPTRLSPQTGAAQTSPTPGPTPGQTPPLIPDAITGPTAGTVLSGQPPESSLARISPPMDPPPKALSGSLAFGIVV